MLLLARLQTLITSRFIALLAVLLTLTACSGNSFSGSDPSPKGASAATTNPPQPPQTGDGAPPATPPGPVPFTPGQVAKIEVTITAPGPSRIELVIDLNQQARTYSAHFNQTILGTDVGGCTVQGDAANFSQLSDSLGSIETGNPTTALLGLADATLKVVLLDGRQLTFQLSLTGLDTNSVPATIPMAQANQLIATIDQLQVNSGTCQLL